MNILSANFEPSQHQNLSTSTHKHSISVFGLGYVGAVSMACFAELNHKMVGVDISEAKVGKIMAGESPIVEHELPELLSGGVKHGFINATTDALQAVIDTDVTFVSVGTPTSEDGGCDLTYVKEAARTIGEGIKRKGTYHLVVMRCSVPPGTTLEVMVPEIEATSGKKLGEGFGICFNPEFLREGTAVADFFAPPKTVIGTSDEKAKKMMTEIYDFVSETIIYSTIGAAEMVKYVDNVWHATKVTFANEIGRLCKAIEVDSHEVMDIFVQDTKLNLSPYYLKPGFAYGGSCLPKEVRAMEHLGDELGIDLPLIKNLGHSNGNHINAALELIKEQGFKRVGFMGITFKPGTDDLRESPTLELMAALLNDGHEVLAFDPNIDPNTNTRQHFAYMQHARPHLKPVMEQMGTILCETTEDLKERCDVLVVSHATPQFRDAVAAHYQGQKIVDLVRLFPHGYTNPLANSKDYVGIGW